MHAEIEDYGTGWFGITIGINQTEIDILIERLQGLKKEQRHFHIASNFDGDGGIGDIEIYLHDEGINSNMAITSLSISPNR